MLFGGLQKNSLIDFPGKIATVLFATGCNFDCPYCHNPDLVKASVDPANAFDQKFAYDFLGKRRGFIEGVVISGGEPTLQEDLGNVCREIKKLGFPVKLDTNGSQPQVIARLIEDGLLDYIAMDIKTDPVKYAPVITNNHQPKNLLKSIRLIMESDIAYEFKTTCIKPIVNETVIKTIARLISGASLYALQEFQKTNILRPEYFKDYPEQYTAEDLLQFKSVASKWVKECLIR